MYNEKGKLLNKNFVLGDYLWPRDQVNPTIVIKAQKIETFGMN